MNIEYLDPQGKECGTRVPMLVVIWAFVDLDGFGVG